MYMLMKELRNRFVYDRSPKFWHESQMPDRAGLVLGQIGRFPLETDYPCETDNVSSKSVKIDGKTDG